MIQFDYIISTRNGWREWFVSNSCIKVTKWPTMTGVKLWTWRFRILPNPESCIFKKCISSNWSKLWSCETLSTPFFSNLPKLAPSSKLTWQWWTSTIWMKICISTHIYIYFLLKMVEFSTSHVSWNRETQHRGLTDASDGGTWKDRCVLVQVSAPRSFKNATKNPTPKPNLKRSTR